MLANPLAGFAHLNGSILRKRTIPCIHDQCSGDDRSGGRFAAQENVQVPTIRSVDGVVADLHFRPGSLPSEPLPDWRAAEDLADHSEGDS